MLMLKTRPAAKGRRNMKARHTQDKSPGGVMWGSDEKTDSQRLPQALRLVKCPALAIPKFQILLIIPSCPGIF